MPVDIVLQGNAVVSGLRSLIFRDLGIQHSFMNGLCYINMYLWMMNMRVREMSF